MKSATEEASPLLSDRIRNALTDAIASGELAAGTPLDEQVFADRYSVSRTPVREAIRQLALGGLVEIRPRRGAVVAHVPPERIMEMFEAMAEVEACCTRLATYRMRPAERSALIEIHNLSRDAVRDLDVDGYDRLNRQFHEALYHSTHNEFLAEQAISIRARLGTFRRTQLRQEGRLPLSREEHDEVMRAIMRGDGEEAALCMRAHMLNAAGAFCAFIEKGAIRE